MTFHDIRTWLEQMTFIAHSLTKWSKSRSSHIHKFPMKVDIIKRRTAENNSIWFSTSKVNTCEISYGREFRNIAKNEVGVWKHIDSFLISSLKNPSFIHNSGLHVYISENLELFIFIAALYGISKRGNKWPLSQDIQAMWCRYLYHLICVRSYQVRAMHRLNFGISVTECASRHSLDTKVISMLLPWVINLVWFCSKQISSLFRHEE